MPVLSKPTKRNLKAPLNTFVRRAVEKTVNKHLNTGADATGNTTV